MTKVCFLTQLNPSSSSIPSLFLCVSASLREIALANISDNQWFSPCHYEERSAAAIQSNPLACMHCIHNVFFGS